MGNEKLITPEPVADVIDVQTSTIPVAEETGYTYQRADGTVERAFSAEDAIARCPVLGKLAIEAPDQANVLLELVAAGKAKMEAEAKKEQQKPKTEEKVEINQKQAEKIEPEKQTKTVGQTEQIRKPEPALPATEQIKEKPQPIQPVLTAYHQAEVAKQQIEDKEDLHSGKVVIETPVVIELQTAESSPRTMRPEATVSSKVETANPSGVKRKETVEALAQPIDVEIRQRQQYEAKTVPPVEAELQSTQEAVKSTDKSHIYSEVIVESSIVVDNQDNLIEELTHEPDYATELTSVALETELLIDDTEDDYADMVYEADELDKPFQSVETDNEMVADNMNQAIEADIEGQLDLLFEPETIETYEQLVALTADIEISGITLSDTTDTEIDAPIEPEPETHADIIATRDFETFIVAQPTFEESLTLETIREQANAQPLEQTLVQLIEYISEPLEELEQIAIWEIMQEIEKALPACYIYQEATEVEPKPQITPEMTEKLFTLLRALGYQNPSEALVSFVARYDLAFLLQALEYMCQLNDKDNRQEFLLSSATSTTTDDTQQRFGKTILSIIARYAVEPVLA